VYVIKNNSSTNILPDKPADFGPSVPVSGLTGYLMNADPSDGCHEISRPPHLRPPNLWISLIQRGSCNFDVKVLNAQKSGYNACIVFDNQTDDLIVMHGTQGVSIPSVFVGKHSGQHLQQYSNNTSIHIRIEESLPIKPYVYFLLMASIGLFGIFIGVSIVVINWACNRARRHKSLLSKRKLKKLPIHRFKSGDVYDTCAICLDEYVDGDKLRLLPCAHAFHCKCIDPWLTEKRNTCPLCKDVVSRPRVNTETEDDETRNLLDDDDNNESSTNEISTVAEVHVSRPSSTPYGSTGQTV
jgi:E3 ubiquitin-protein ligase RNF13